MLGFSWVSFLVALGVAALAFSLQELKVKLPRELLWVLLVIGLASIAYGLLVGLVRLLLRFPTRRRVMSLAMAVAAGAVLGAGVGGFGWLLAERHRAELDSPPVAHAKRLRPILKDMLDVGNAIKYDIRGDKNAGGKLALYARRIEDWRTDISHFLLAKLPNSGADVKFLTFRPRVGQGGLTYEYEGLNDMRTNLAYLIDNLESYCSRSSSIPDGVEGLVALRVAGVALRNRSIHGDAQWMVLHHEFEEWQKDVVREMRSIGVKPGDVGWFQTRDQVPPAEFPHAINTLHAKDLRELTEKLTRLQEIIQRHDRRP